MRKPTSSTNQQTGKRRLAWVAATLGALVLLLAGLALLALYTEPGTRMLWQMASRLMPGQLSGDVAGGTLSKGMTLRNVVYRDGSRLIKIDRLESGWHLFRSPLTLEVRFLRIGTADMTLFPTPQAPTPRTLPRQITLPLAIDLQSATVQQLIVHRDADSARYSDIRLQASSDRARHTLDLDNAVTPYGTIAASLRLNGMPPFDLAGTARLNRMVQEERYRFDARLSGTLAALGVQLDAAGNKLNGHATIDATPFAAVPFSRAQIGIRHLDPQAFNAAWPHADLELRASLTPVTGAASEPAQLAVAGPVSVINAKPGAIDQDLLPLVSASAQVKLDEDMQQLAQLTIRLPDKAVLKGGGEVRGNVQGKLALLAERFDPHALHTRLRPSQLRGPLDVRWDGNTQHGKLDLSGPSYSVAAHASFGPKQIALHSATLQAGAAQLEINGMLARDARQAYSVTGKLTDFNPGLFLSSTQRSGAKGRAASRAKPSAKPIHARINTDFEAEGALRPQPSAKVQFKVHDSMYANLPMTGGGTVQVDGERLLPSDARLSIAGNALRIKGSFGEPADRATLDIDAPVLGRLGFGLSGLLRVDGRIGGTLERPLLDARYRAERLAFGEHRLAWLSGQARIQGVPGTAPDARVELDVNARGVHSGDIDLNRFNANIDGTYASHAIRVDSIGQLRGKALELSASAQGRLVEQAQGLAWDGVLRTLENRGLARISMTSPMPLHVAPGQIELGATRLTIAQAVIDLKSFRYDTNQIRTEGAFSALDIGHLLALRQQLTGSPPPIHTDLVLDGRWNVTLADSADGFVQIARRRGDVRITDESTAGLTALALRADLQANRINFDAQISATRIGSGTGQGWIELQRPDGRLTLTPQASVSGRIAATIPRLRTIASLAGPRIALDGSVGIELAIAGTLGEPNLSGTVAGDRLSVTLYDQGLRLRDGIARIGLDNNVVELRQVEFRGGDGSVRATGRIPLDRASRELSATIVADKLGLLASPSGQLTLSGQARAANISGQLLVNGKFVVDHARFSLPEKAAPKLDEDVVVIRGGKVRGVATSTASKPIERPAGPYTPSANIELDLGNDFRFEGSGAKATLAGTVMLQSEPGETLQGFGTVRVVEGSYEAFGTELAIERGDINFQGPLRNPNLNFLAMRREQEVAAGVTVTGTVQQPRVQLVSEPDLPQEEQLSWLVFGRGGGTEPGQAQSAAKGAALGLLNKFGGQRIANTFGLDALSVGESAFGLGGAQVVNLGKEISNRLYIGYEQSLAGAENVLKLTYELTQHWSVVLRGGTITGLDLFYSNRFDAKR